jgi:hypothetical protein
MGAVPVILTNTRYAGKGTFQVGLPMMRTGTAKTGDDENRNRVSNVLYMAGCRYNQTVSG